MKREAGAEPPPKGKVRQLYPPPEFDEEYVEESSTPAPPSAQSDRDSNPSMFVNDVEELEERRRLARERADTRRRPDDAEGSEEPPLIRPPFGNRFEDDEEE